MGGAATVRALTAQDAVLLRAAGQDDLPEIEAHIRLWAERGLLLPLGGPALRAEMEGFRVLAPRAAPGRILGFGWLRRYTDRLAEIRSLAVDRDHQGQGLGRLLVEDLLDEARDEGMGMVFALTRAPGFFERLRFRAVPLEQLPEKVYSDCALCPRRERCDELAMLRDLE